MKARVEGGLINFNTYSKDFLIKYGWVTRVVAEKLSKKKGKTTTKFSQINMEGMKGYRVSALTTMVGVPNFSS